MSDKHDWQALSVELAMNAKKNLDAKDDEIARLQSEVERLRGRCGELEANMQQFVCSGTGPLADAENRFVSAVILRKQAEAVVPAMMITGREFGRADLTYSALRIFAEEYAQRLRQQAAEIEGGGQ